MTRIFLFILTNLAILLVFGTTARILGVNQYIEPYGLNLSNLMIFAGILGFGGAFISLMLSKMVAKWTMKLNIIDGTENPEAAWIYSTVQKHAQQMNIKMPDVAVYNSLDMNAFATGPSKNNSLVAVSSGLLMGMHKNEVEAVIGHEVAHIANGDMVTSTLLQGVLNTFVIFLARVVAFALDKVIGGSNNNNSQPGIVYVITIFVLELVFGILASIIVAYHSRRREFVADKGGASLAGKQSMINALARLGSQNTEQSLNGGLKAFGIRGSTGKIFAIFSTHPPIEKRIQALTQQ